ncbi:type II toxin-antitoxin system VapC family toxin [Sphaerisporangium perillae]|uniref:type II toxin-antitoxin system VapC family toxin n=1 Tax=Sphaerisporangium perillae TaxID=2935860 RepID=UPI0020105839|nr:type II toxin-antitoxin system VapC family toxin [Sphaerisporangium perillae]
MTLVDSCVLIDVIGEDSRWQKWSSVALAAAADEGPIVINPIIYAELSAGIETMEELEYALPSEDYRREPLPYEAGFLVGKAYGIYRRRGGGKTSPLPDFYIGAHAAVKHYRLLTRDAARYRTYFPRVTLIAPE